MTSLENYDITIDFRHDNGTIVLSQWYYDTPMVILGHHKDNVNSESYYCETAMLLLHNNGTRRTSQSYCDITI